MALRIKSMLRWLLYSTYATLLAYKPSATTYLFIHTWKTSRLYQKKNIYSVVINLKPIK